MLTKTEDKYIWLAKIFWQVDSGVFFPVSGIRKSNFWKTQIQLFVFFQGRAHGNGAVVAGLAVRRIGAGSGFGGCRRRRNGSDGGGSGGGSRL
jgi:hypothetical protein